MSDVYTETMNDEHKLEPHYPTTGHSDIVTWLEAIPLSRPIQNFETDFSDGMIIAEIVNFFFPDYIDLNRFATTPNMSQRTKNWRLLKCDILPKLGLHAPGTVVHEIIHGDHRVIELFLLYLREKLEEHLIDRGNKSYQTCPSVMIERDHLPLNVEHEHLPQLMLTPRIPRRKGLKLTNTNMNQGRIQMNSYMYDDALKVKDKEIDLLKGQLDQCEDRIKTKDERIQQLEEILEKLNSKILSS